MRTCSRALLFGSCLATLAATGRRAGAEVLWRGDFEAGNLTQWSRTLNGRGISVVDEPIAGGKHAARVVITSSDLWSNGLNRVELNHAPPRERTAEGRETYFGWSFFISRTLGGDGHQIGYWETSGQYKQLMSFSVKGNSIDFSTRLPSNRRHWTGTLRTGVWHRLAMHIRWARSGSVSVWLDGQLVVDRGAAQTTYMGNPAFIQLGILRSNRDQGAETIYLDEAIEGTSLADVLGPTSPGPSDGGTADAGPAEDMVDAGSTPDAAHADARPISIDAVAGGAPDRSPPAPFDAAPADRARRPDPMPEEEPDDDSRSAAGASGGCAVAPTTGSRGLPLLLLTAVGMALASGASRVRQRRRRRAPTAPPGA